MSVIIRLQNLPWSANALDIRNFFRGLSIPEGGVHIVGGELGDAFIAFSTDEDARQAMMLDGGKIKEIQVKLLLSSRSEMHKVIETARQTVPILSLAAPAPAPAPAPVAAPVTLPASVASVVPPAPVAPVIAPFSAALSANPLSSFGIPGLGNPQEIPQPAVIELPPTQISPNENSNHEEEREDQRIEKTRGKDRRRSRSRSRDRKDRKRDRRDRSRSRDRRRRDRSRSRDRRDRKRDRKDRSRSRDRSPSRRSRDRRRSPTHSQDDSPNRDIQTAQTMPFGNPGNLPPQLHQMLQNNAMPMNIALPQDSPRFNDPTVTKMQELAKKRNPNAFQGGIDQNGSKQSMGRGGIARNTFRREGRSRFEEPQQHECCVAIRNAPTHTSYGDVRRFFPFMIDKHGIKMINDNMGRRTGNIYVRFCEGRSKQLALQRKNIELKGAMVSVEDLDDDTYDAAVDSFLPYREDNEQEDADLLIADIQERSKPAYTILKLADLPNYVKEHDIIKAFNEFSLMSIIFNDCRMTRTKIAFVQFAKAEDARLAYEQKERYVFGKRQPTVTTMTDNEYESIKNAQNDKIAISQPTPEPPQEVVTPRDPRQRRQQFDNGSGPPNAPPPIQNQNPTVAPYFIPPPFGQNQGFPGGQFPGPQFGGFPPPNQLDPHTAAANWANRPPFGGPMEQRPGPAKDVRSTAPSIDEESLDCVLMKGLPRDATDRTIVKFLADTGAVPARIHLMLDGSGSPSGDCFCEFRSTQEARKAASKHGQNLDGLRVTVDLVPRTVVEEALEGPKTSEPEPIVPNVPHPQFFQPEIPRGGFNNRGMFRGRGGFDRGGYDRGGFNNRGGFDTGRGSYRSRGGFDRGARGYDGRGRGRGRGGGMQNSYENGGIRNDEHDSTLDDFGAPGCVVSMENVPFRATIDEILHFFSEFDLTQDDVIRRYNERGQPTGDARVAFRTPFDAQRAVKTRHMDTIHDRRINLNIL